MQGIMFNERFGLESATLDGSKTRTTRNELDRKTGVGLGFINRLYDEWYYIAPDGDLEFDGINNFIIDDAYGDCYSFNTRYKVGEIVAIKQSYGSLQKLASDIVTKYINTKGWMNKMFVRNDLMPHHIQIVDIKLERLQDISEEDCIKEGIKETIDWPYTPSYFYGVYPNEKAYGSVKDAFASLIDDISGEGTWKQNNWNVVYYYKLID